MALLTYQKIKNAKAKQKEYTLSDGAGLYLRVLPSGKKIFFFQSKKGGKLIKKIIGDASLISLENARKIAFDLRYNQAISPKKKTLFKDAAKDFLAHKERVYVGANSFKKLSAYYKNYFFVLDEFDINEIKKADILKALDFYIQRGQKQSFIKALGFVRMLFDFAINYDLCEINVARNIDYSALFALKEVKHKSHLKSFDEVRELVERIRNFSGAPTLKALGLFQLLTAVRPSEARLAKWDEMDFKNKIWRIPASRMKSKTTPHEVTLNGAMLGLIESVKEWSRSELVFESLRPHRPWSERAVADMLKNIGYTPDQLMPHGFRGTFATLANESRAEHGFGNDIIQACLAHSTQNKVASAYNHATYAKERALLLEWWAKKIFS